MSNLSKDVPDIPAVITNPELPAQQDSARKETDPAPSQQSVPPEPIKQDEPVPPNGQPEVDAKTRANRENAQKSTEPRSEAGRAASSKNAVKHSLFSADVSKYFRSEEECQRYQRFIDGLVKDLEPVGDYESVLARRAADIQFRLEMLRTAEFKVYSGEGLPTGTLEGFLDAKGDVPGLASLYDTRFQSSFSRTMKELRLAQQARRDKELRALEQLKDIAISHIQQNATFDPAKFGFVISRDFIFNQAHLANAKKLAQFCGGNGVVEKKVVDYVAKVPPKAA